MFHRVSVIDALFAQHAIGQRVARLLSLTGSLVRPSQPIASHPSSTPPLGAFGLLVAYRDNSWRK